MNYKLLKQAIQSSWPHAAFFEGRLGGLSGSESNDWRSAHCPFHDDTHRSFRVNVENGGWICNTGCGKGDIFDFYGREYGLDPTTKFTEILDRMVGEMPTGFLESVTNAPAATTQPVTTPPVIELENIVTFMKDADDAGVPFLVNEILPSRCLSVFAGWPKSQKSWLALDLGIAVASGGSFLGRQVNGGKGRVIIVGEEDARAEVQKRLWWLARGRKCDPRDLDLFVACQRGMRLDDDGPTERLFDWVRGLEPTLVILDPLRRLHFKEENDATKMQPVFDVLRRLSALTTVVLVAHTRKNNDGDGATAGRAIRGSGDLWAVARTVLGVRRNKDLITVEPEGNYVTSNDAIKVCFNVAGSEGNKTAVFELESDDPEQGVGLAERIRAELKKGQGLTTSQIRDRIKGSNAHIDKVLKDLLAGQQVAKESRSFTDAKGRVRPVEVWVHVPSDASEDDLPEPGPSGGDGGSVPF